jgi:hypothetical protein
MRVRFGTQYDLSSGEPGATIFKIRGTNFKYLEMVSCKKLIISKYF